MHEGSIPNAWPNNIPHKHTVKEANAYYKCGVCLNTSKCIEMHLHASTCFYMCPDVPKCIQMYRNVSKCIYLRVPRCIEMYRHASKCEHLRLPLPQSIASPPPFPLPQNAFCFAPLELCRRKLQLAPGSAKLHLSPKAHTVVFAVGLTHVSMYVVLSWPRLLQECFGRR